MSAEGKNNITRRRLFPFMMGAALSIPGSIDGIARIPSYHLTPELIEHMEKRSDGRITNDEYEMSAGYALADSKESGADVSGAIIELYDDGKISPRVAMDQIWMLMARTNHGEGLSREDREAIVILTNWWPDGPERSECLNYLRTYPALRRAFRDVGRPETEALADSRR